jgi:uncharacterized SAM-binding protein YcdF (DUF218 family)
MFFFLSKAVAPFLVLSNLFIALVVVGILLTLTRFRRGGIRTAIAGLVLLLIAGFSPAGNILTHQLESRFPPWDASRGAPAGIVVLGRPISTRLSQAHGAPVVDDAADRFFALANLARQFPNARIVFAGGTGALAGGPAEADFVGPLLDDMGVPRERVALERRSRNTAENAAFSKDIAKPKPGERWLLVTSAWHMPRAVGCFRRVGFAVEAYPVDWRTGPGFEFRLPRSFAGGLGRTDLAVNEWLGLLAYWLTGRTTELLAGPA